MRKRANQGRKLKHSSKRHGKHIQAKEHQREIVDRLKKRGGHWIQKIPGVMVG